MLSRLSRLNVFVSAPFFLGKMVLTQSLVVHTITSISFGFSKKFPKHFVGRHDHVDHANFGICNNVY